MVLPWVPATARQRRVAQMAASISERGHDQDAPRRAPRPARGCPAARPASTSPRRRHRHVLGPVPDRHGDALRAQALGHRRVLEVEPGDGVAHGGEHQWRWRSCRRRRCPRCGCVRARRGRRSQPGGRGSAGMGVHQLGHPAPPRRGGRAARAAPPMARAGGRGRPAARRARRRAARRRTRRRARGPPRRPHQRLGVAPSGGRRGAPGSGTRMAGTPATTSSATVMAPARHTHDVGGAVDGRACGPRRAPRGSAAPSAAGVRSASGGRGANCS